MLIHTRSSFGGTSSKKILITVSFFLLTLLMSFSRLHALGVNVTQAEPTAPISYDETVSGVINTPGEVLDFTFDNSGSNTVVIRLVATTGNLDPEFELRDPGSVIVCSDSTFGVFVEEICILSATGMHTIFVSDLTGTNTGNFNLYLQNISAPANAQAIAFDETKSDVISPDVEMDAFTFSGSSGERVMVRLAVTSGDLDPEFRVYRPDGTELCGTTSFGSFIDEICVLDSSGTFVILTSDLDGLGTGNFNLYLQNINVPANAQAIAFDETKSDVISPDVEMDAFAFSGSSGERVMVRLAVTSGDLDPEFRVYRPDGTELCGTTSFGSFIDEICVLDSSGTFVILTSDLDGLGTGNFNLYLQNINAPANAQAIAFDETKSDVISPDVEMDAFTFSGSSGERVMVRLAVTSGDLDPEFRVYRPDGTELCGTTSFGSFIDEICVLDSSGTFVILTSDLDGLGTGNFNLYLQNINAPANAQAIAFDETKSDVISPDVEMDAFTFSGSSGERVIVRLAVTSGDLDPEFRVYRPDGTELCGTTSFGSFIDEICVLDSSGTFVILTSDLDGLGTGNFNLYLQNISAPANAQVIAFDETKSDVISPDVEMDAFTFSGSSGERVIVRLAVTSGDLDPEFRVYRPDGTELCGTTSFGSFIEEICVLDSSGTFVILTSDLDGLGTGNFNLYLQNINAPANAPLTGFGKPETATISPDVEMDAYKFVGFSGDRVLVGVSVASGDLDPQFRVFRPDGTELCEASSFGTSIEEECVLDTDGTFIALVNDIQGLGTGTYTLNLTCLLCPNSADLMLSGQVQPFSARPDEPLHYTFEVENEGPLAVTNTVFTATLAAEVSFVSAEASQGTCIQDTGGLVVCEIGSLPPNNLATVTIIVTPINTGVIETTAEVMADEVDGDCGNNEVTLVTTVSNDFRIFLPFINRS